ncbi:MAG TPA: TetR/AcrR family transcriptional regulator [Caulobacteraceae bacterium]|jgi:AcrR family transcriptional regulator|nr:TetR/AcrR family transcriptional regulator [Caulobacteraceae bacterium]
MSRREDAKAERRHRIVTAARDLIRETGDTGLSMRAIAARAGVSLSTPYNLFGSKQAILLAVLEDIRDFNERFARLRSDDPVERIFQALSMSIRYYVEDPDFYRTLWTGVFDMSGKEVRSALAAPERDAFWLSLVNAAAAEGALAPGIDTRLLFRSLDLTFAAVMLNWVLGALSLDQLEPTAALGYALTLRGAASPAWRERLGPRIAEAQERLLTLSRSAAAA